MCNISLLACDWGLSSKGPCVCLQIWSLNLVGTYWNIEELDIGLLFYEFPCDIHTFLCTVDSMHARGACANQRLLKSEEKMR